MSEVEALADAYFGQQPPGLTPQVFAPDLLSRTKPQWAFCAEFSPDHREFYFSREDPELQIDQIVWMRRGRAKWTEPKPAPFNTRHNTNDSRISPDGRRLYFRSQRPLPGNDTAEERFFLWSVTRSGNGWGEAQPVLFGETPGRTSYVGVAADGTLYFSFRAQSNVGESDLHRSALLEGSHAPPENLGSTINTVYAEGDTFVAPDESFLVVTLWDHPENRGDSDLYISFRKPDGGWSALENLGEPINTDGNENCAALSPDGKYFFYVAVRTDGGQPTIDTYWVDARILERHEPAP